MDMNRMRDFMTRLQQAHQQAVDSGNMPLADQYAAIADQAEPHIQAMAGPQGQEGPRGVPGGPVRTESPGRTVGNQPPPQKAAPPDVQREAMQEAGGSWLDKLFSGSTPNPTGAGAYAGQGGMNPAMAQQQQPMNKASMLPDTDFMTKPLWGDSDLLFNQKEQIGAIQGVQNGLFGNKWFKPEVADPKKMTVPEAEKQTGWRLNGPLDPNEVQANGEAPYTDDEELGALMARNGRADVGDAAPPPPPPEDPYAVLGEDPSKAGFMDFLGLIMGGKNYLNYKDKQVNDYNNKKFAISQGLRGEKQQDKYHTASNAIANQKLDLEYAKNLADIARHAEENEDKNNRAIFEGYSRTPVPDVLSKNPQAQAAANALNRKKQIETKKGN